jgi:hypothetical protein
MMSEPKPLASLSAGLLARKGGARPAMRRQPLGSGPGPLAGTGYDDLGWNDMGYDVDPDQSEPAHLVDLKPLMPGSVLAHNAAAEQAVENSAADAIEPELAEDVAVPAEPLVPEVPEIVRQQESLIDRVAAVARKVEQRPATQAKAPRPVRAREKAAFTLRLDADRHLRLRLASAVTGRSAQHILTDLLDDYLASLPEIDAMASRLPATRPARRATKA